MYGRYSAHTQVSLRDLTVTKKEKTVIQIAGMRIKSQLPRVKHRIQPLFKYIDLS